jgi:hypothetical protein
MTCRAFFYRTTPDPAATFLSGMRSCTRQIGWKGLSGLKNPSYAQQGGDAPGYLPPSSPSELAGVARNASISLFINTLSNMVGNSPIRIRHYDYRWMNSGWPSYAQVCPQFLWIMRK